MKEFCKHGHEWVDENIYTNPQGYKICRICSDISRKRHGKQYPWAESFRKAKRRCVKKTDERYRCYGGRGIRFLMTLKDFEFLWFRDKAVKMKCPTIDRIDNDGNYELSNCRFIERSENSRKDICGENAFGAKLKNYQAIEIRTLQKEGVCQSKLAKLFNVSKATISAIVNNVSWQYV